MKIDSYHEKEIIKYAKDRDNIIPIVKNNKLICVERIYSGKYIERKKEYFESLHKSYIEDKSYLSNFNNVLLIGKNKFTRYLKKIIKSAKLIDYKQYNNSYENCYIITSNLYKAGIYNGITVKQFINNYENYIDTKKSKIIVSKKIKELKEMGIYTLTVKVPKELPFKTELEKIRSIAKINPNNIVIKDEHILELYNNLNYFKEFHKDFLERPSIYKSKNKFIYIDYESKYINIKNGMRYIPNRNENYINNVYLIGPCIASGHYAEDKKTIAYYLQEALNDYRVTCYGGFGNKWDMYVSILDSFELRKNDIVIFIDEKDIFDKVNYDCYDDFEKLHKQCCFYWDRPIHCTEKGYKCISNGIAKYILSNFKTDGNLIRKDSFDLDMTSSSDDFKKYIKSLCKYKIKSNNKKIGSIVMNCNPFTNGHLYLIEEARKCVDYLYIFVVEEDKSFFSFKERFNMVKSATKKMKNVVVLPSGKFIISTLTFNEYFNKEKEKDITIDASLDINIFGKYIAKILNITYRFVGSELKDKVTKQYNEKLKKYWQNIILI